jgi:outer membrane immunogenic protein
MKSRLIAGAAIAAASAIGLSAPAFAQDAEGIYQFNGPYVGGSFGLGFNENNRDQSVLFDTNRDGRFGDVVRTTAGADAFSPGFCNGAATSPLPGNCQNDKDDMEYYGRVGWDAQRGNFVVGVMGEFGKSQVRQSVAAFSTTPAQYTFTREFDWNASIRGRAGYAAGGRTLFYVAGGPAYARIRNSFSTNNAANSFTPVNERHNSWGVTAGGGVEQKIGRNLSLGVEYMYNQYRDDDYVVQVGPGTAPATNPFLLVNAQGTDMIRSDEKFRFHSIRATAAFRF